MHPRRLSLELRRSTSEDLRRRRWVLGLSLVGAAMGGIVSLYQTGIVRRLPDPPFGPFDSSRVDASEYAYRRLRTPDGLLMLVNYAVTAALAGAGGVARAERTPWLAVATGGKALYDTITCLRLAREEWAENRAFCVYCQLATLASAASLVLAAPESLRAARCIAA